MEEQAKPYMNPYLAGVLLGLLLLTTIYLTGRGLGASGAMKGVVLEVVAQTAPRHWASTQFYQEYAEAHPEGNLRSWLVFEVLGVVLGAFLSGLLAHRLGFKLEKGPHITTRTRLVAAVLGGLLFGLGAQFGRGCTSGAALSSMAVLSLGGILTMMAIFGTGYALAYFFRRLWL
ncbi:MAG: hypothetical protein OHK0039_15050 [Bacteroidia bacterium]